MFGRGCDVFDGVRCCNYIQVKLSDYIGKKYVILFFYPLDFTFVCPTGALTILCSVKETIHFCLSFLKCIHANFAEITAFSDRHEEFEKINTEILGVSVDSVVCYFPYIWTHSCSHETIRLALTCIKCLV